MVKDNPDISCAEAKKITGEQWTAASAEVRKIYTSRRRELQKVYNDNIASYNAREHALIRAAIRKVRESRGYRASNALNTARPSQHPIPSTWPCHPPQPTERLHGPARTTISVTSGFTGLLPSLPAPIGSLGSPYPIGLPVSSQPMLSLAPAGSFDVAEPVHSLTSLGSAEVTVLNESPASTSPPANSGNLPRQTVSIEDSISSIRAIVSGLAAMADANVTSTLAEPIVSPEPIPLGMQPMPVGIQDTAEITSIVKSPEPSLCADSPAPAETTHVPIVPVISVMGAEPAEPLIPTKKKAKKKRNHAADDDVQGPGADQSTSPHRKKDKRDKRDLKDSKKKKHKSKIVVKLEENIDAMTTNMDNSHTDNADPIVNAAIKAEALLNFTFGSNHLTLNQ
ncbi:hypothetical protein GGI24_006105 [Coemansia furcata]|nr:hypothetical protein GGI24_006105 [Coemansia furcata]